MTDFNSTKGHPSYGCVRINRVSGGSGRLVGSAAYHQHYVTLSIHEAEVRDDDDDHGQRLYARRELIEIGLTEAQFAEMITKFNVYEGTPCTLQRRQNFETGEYESVEPPPAGRTMKDSLQHIVEDSTNNVQEDLKRIADEIREITNGRLTKKQQARMDMLLRVLESKTSSNLKFAVERINEVSEKALARAKVEMEATGHSIIQRMGLSAVADQVKGLLPGFDPTEPNKGSLVTRKGPDSVE